MKNTENFGEEESYARKGIFSKTKKLLGKIPFLDKVLTAYYCASDSKTPLKTKATLWSALAYFVSPIDAVPDAIPVVGYTDDGAVIALAITAAALFISILHQANANLWLQRFDKCTRILETELEKIKSEMDQSRSHIIEKYGLENYTMLDNEYKKIFDKFGELRIKIVEESKSLESDIKNLCRDVTSFGKKFHAYRDGTVA